MKVLVVDSSVLIIERLQNMLSETGTIENVYGAVSYKDAAELFNKIDFSVVLLDDNLPANRSIELLTLIKKTNNDMPVIVLANGIDHFTKLKYKVLGADQFFDKYHEFELIPGVINSLSSRTLTIQNYEQE